MPLKLKITKEEFAKLPEALQGFYSEKDGEFSLLVDGLEDTGALKRAKEHEKGLRQAAETKAKELEAKLGEITDEGNRRSGNVEALEKSFNEKIAKLEEGYKGQIAKAQAHLKTSLVDNVAKDIAHKISTAPAIIIPHIKARLAADFDGETPSTKVLDKNGQLSALTIDELSNEFKTNPDFLPIIIGSKATGSGAAGSQSARGRVGGTSAGEKPANLASMQPAELVAYIESLKQAQGA